MVGWMNKLLEKVKNNWRVYFCYLLILGGIFFALAIVIFKPMKIILLIIMNIKIRLL